MCEFLIQVAELAHPDPRHAAELFRPGDVIVAVPDGWAWSDAERAHAGWLILKVPGLSTADASRLETAGRVPPNADLLPAPRAFGLDLARLPRRKRRLTPAELDGLVVAREPTPDPDVIGAPDPLA